MNSTSSIKFLIRALNLLIFRLQKVLFLKQIIFDHQKLFMIP